MAWVQIPASTLYVGWVCCWFSPLLREVFLRVLVYAQKFRSVWYPRREGIKDGGNLGPSILFTDVSNYLSAELSRLSACGNAKRFVRPLLTWLSSERTAAIFVWFVLSTTPPPPPRPQITVRCFLGRLRVKKETGKPQTRRFPSPGFLTKELFTWKGGRSYRGRIILTPYVRFLAGSSNWGQFTWYQ